MRNQLMKEIQYSAHIPPRSAKTHCEKSLVTPFEDARVSYL